MEKAFPYERMTTIYLINLLTQSILTIAYYAVYLVYSGKEIDSGNMSRSDAIFKFIVDIVYYLQLYFAIYMMFFLMWLIYHFTQGKDSQKTVKMDETSRKEVPYIVFM